MTNIIDHTYFKGKLLIPNIAEDTDVQAYITSLITEHQYDFLNKLLGPVLYPQFVTWYTAPSLDNSSAFYDLLKGKSFEHDGSNYVWVGLQNTDKISPLANYVYANYLELTATYTAPAGESKTKAKNAEPASPLAKIVTQWNAMVLMLSNYIAYMAEYFPDDELDTCLDIFNLRNSLGL